MSVTAIATELREKPCKTCKESWPADLEFFYSDGKTKDGLMSECKSCYNGWRRKPKQPVMSEFLTLELKSLFTKLIQKPEHKALAKP